MFNLSKQRQHFANIGAQSFVLATRRYYQRSGLPALKIEITWSDMNKDILSFVKAGTCSLVMQENIPGKE